jgi:hypothetical protein
MKCMSISSVPKMEKADEQENYSSGGIRDRPKTE